MACSMNHFYRALVGRVTAPAPGCTQSDAGDQIGLIKVAAAVPADACLFPTITVISASTASVGAVLAMVALLS